MSEQKPDYEFYLDGIYNELCSAPQHSDVHNHGIKEMLSLLLKSFNQLNETLKETNQKLDCIYEILTAEE